MQNPLCFSVLESSNAMLTMNDNAAYNAEFHCCYAFSPIGSI